MQKENQKGEGDQEENKEESQNVEGERFKKEETDMERESSTNTEETDVGKEEPKSGSEKSEAKEAGSGDKKMWVGGVIVALVLIVAGVLLFFQKGGAGPAGSAKDCGVSKIFLNQEDVSQEKMGNDETLKCLGNSILDCEKAEAELETKEIGKIGLTVKGEGEAENKCRVKMKYGSAEQMGSEQYKNYADTYLTCPIDMEEMGGMISANTDLSKSPSNVVPVVLMYIGMQSANPETDCEGSLLEEMSSQQMPQSSPDSGPNSGTE